MILSLWYDFLCLLYLLFFLLYLLCLKHILLSFPRCWWLTVLGNLCYQFVFDGFILSGV
ncbi:unnamed protein product [Prunus brigantina]